MKNDFLRKEDEPAPGRKELLSISRRKFIAHYEGVSIKLQPELLKLKFNSFKTLQRPWKAFITL